MQEAGHLCHIFPARHYPCAPPGTCLQQGQRALTPSPQPLTAGWKRWMDGQRPSNIPVPLGPSHTTCWRSFSKVPQEDSWRVRKSLSPGDLQSRRDKPAPWGADTFMDLPEGQHREALTTALWFTSPSPHWTERDLLGGLSPDTRHHSCLTHRSPNAFAE